MANYYSRSAGFTLVELLVAIAIIIILTAIAVPTYIHYTKKNHYGEVVQVAERHKEPIEKCLVQRGGKLKDCDSGKYGIPPRIVSSVGQVGSVTVYNSVITVIPNEINDIKAVDSYILTPTYTPNGIVWAGSGGGCEAGLAPNC